MNISVFGSSQPKTGDLLYANAYELGRMLAKAGHTVITGGYIGTMEAVSRGAFESKGHVIGVTCLEIERWRGVKPNEWVKEIRQRYSLVERLHELLLSCDASLALQGGPGTLTEVALAWNLMIINSAPAKPLILIGHEWKSVMEFFFNSFKPHIPVEQFKLLRFVPNTKDAITLLNSI